MSLRNKAVCNISLCLCVGFASLIVGFLVLFFVERKGCWVLGFLFAGSVDKLIKSASRFVVHELFATIYDMFFSS